MPRTLLRGPVAVAGIIGLALVLAAPASVRGQASSYADFDALSAELRALVDGSDHATIRSIGRSHEGRDLWVVEIARRDGMAISERPGVLVVGNLEGDHVVGSALAVGIVRHLLGAGDDAARDEVLANQVVYVVPRLNPDGAEAMFAAVKQDRTRNGRPFDDDNDGRVDEDPAEDLNGDGVITVMRAKDPYGAYMVDPDNARLMKRADAAEGETGEYALYIEGTDSDGDGFFNEDGAGGVDLNRNFQHAYPYFERDAGTHMIGEPESRALMDFVISHRNIGAILTFGHSDNLVSAPDSGGNLTGVASLALPVFAAASNADALTVGVFGAAGGRGRGFGGFGGRGGGGGAGPFLRGAQPGRDNDPASGQRPATSVNRADLEYYSTVSEAYKEITGITRVGNNRAAAGAFFQYGYFQFGVPSFSTQGWGLAAAAAGDGAAARVGPSSAGAAPAVGGGRGGRGAGGGRGSFGQAAQRAGGSGSTAGGNGADASILTALEEAGIDGFVDWTAYDHPDLGDVEIGGFRPYAATNPPADRLADLGTKHGEFVVKLASMLPRVSIAGTAVESLGGGVFSITAEIQNSGYLPTSLQHGVVSRTVAPTTVQIQVDPADVLSGAAKTSTVGKLDGSGTREKFTWVIRGRPGASVEIRVLAQKGGTDTATVTLR